MSAHTASTNMSAPINNQIPAAAKRPPVAPPTQGAI